MNKLRRNLWRDDRSGRVISFMIRTHLIDGLNLG